MSNQLNKSLYQPLPDEVTEGSIPEVKDVCEFLSNFLPHSEAYRAKDDLNKRTLSISLNSKVIKKAKPRRRKVGLSQKERRSLGLLRLPKFNMTYEESLSMNKLWQSYMHRFLNLDHLQGKEWYNPRTGNLWDQMSMTLLKADYHGAHLRVHSSLCNSMIGIEGIIIIDTKFTFVIVGKDDVVRTLPKQSCIFEVFLNKYKFKIFGKYFCIRPSERSTKKIKCSFIPSL